jgi:hypothetical protein
MKQYYIYTYLRKDGSPYYIGKGSGNRAYRRHNGCNGKPPKDKSRIVIMEDNLTEVGALALERFYIRWYGRKNLGTGCLRNMTDGGEGVSNPSEEIRKILSSKMIGDNNPAKRQDVREKISRNSSKSRTGKKHSDSHKEAIAKGHQKEWIITFPDGHKEKILDLQRFARYNGLSVGNLHGTVTGRLRHTKGYSAQRYE